MAPVCEKNTVSPNPHHILIQLRYYTRQFDVGSFMCFFPCQCVSSHIYFLHLWFAYKPVKKNNNNNNVWVGGGLEVHQRQIFKKDGQKWKRSNMCSLTGKNAEFQSQAKKTVTARFPFFRPWKDTEKEALHSYLHRQRSSPQDGRAEL